MKNCARHSSDLSEALKRKGLWHLVKPERAQDFAVRWLQGTATAVEFDPYVVASLEINMKMVKFLRIQPEHPQECPLCRVNLVLCNSEADKAWIDNVTDLMLLTAKVNDLA